MTDEILPAAGTSDWPDAPKRSQRSLPASRRDEVGVNGFPPRRDVRHHGEDRRHIMDSEPAIANLLTVIRGEAQLLNRALAKDGGVSPEHLRARLAVIVARVDEASVELQRLAARQHAQPRQPCQLRLAPRRESGDWFANAEQ